jgi:hypothetical protein
MRFDASPLPGQPANSKALFDEWWETLIRRMLNIHWLSI